MRFDFDAGLQSFREEVRTFIQENLPAELKEWQMSAGTLFTPSEHEKVWMRILSKKGWSVPHWPCEHGGLGWSPQQLFIFDEELQSLFAPALPLAGTHMVGPLVYTFGTEQQKARFLPAIREGSVSWCQGFSEPGAGSDLVSMKTRADLEGDKYVVNGQKIWTSGASECEWGFFLVKTDTQCKPQLGVSVFLIDMKTPGIKVRQIPQLNGDAHLCETFLDNVEVPVENLIGEPGKGWSYAKFLLEQERTASSFIYFNKREMRRVREIAKAEALGGSAVARDPAFRARIARVEAEVSALEWSVLRVLAHEKFAYDEMAVVSVLKVRGSELQQAITELQMDLLGQKSLRVYPMTALRADAGTQWPDYAVGRTNLGLLMRAATIYGGAKQIQKNIIASRAFGL
jgi:alkylation response protein AidB-like acyl-CoA dehydrogenase